MLRVATDYNQVSVIDLTGEVGYPEVQEVRRVILSLLRKRQHRMILNFSGVNHIHYRSLDLLKKTLSHLKTFHGDLKVTGLSPYVRDIINFTGAADWIESFDTVAEAILSMRWREHTLH